MRYLTLSEILHLYDRIISSSGGTHGVRDFGALKSALSQPRLTFDQTDLYPDIVAKASSLCFSLIMNHPFVDGNKRIGHAAMETFLILNGYEIDATTDDQEQIILDLAAGKVTRHEFATWLKSHIHRITIV
jgi:death-on-curing protein